MELLVKIVDDVSIAGGKGVLLCDENGTPLPTQIRASVSNDVGEYPVIDVRLVVDGDKVRFE